MSSTDLPNKIIDLKLLNVTPSQNTDTIKVDNSTSENNIKEYIDRKCVNIEKLVEALSVKINLMNNINDNHNSNDKYIDDKLKEVQIFKSNALDEMHNLRKKVQSLESELNKCSFKIENIFTTDSNSKSSYMNFKNINEFLSVI